MGLQQAASSCIGHEIGKGNVAAAKHVYKVAQYLSLIFITASVVGLYAFHGYIIGLFTNIEQVHIIFNQVILLIVSSAIPDMMKVYLQGVIKALGIQGKVIYLNFIAYYVINIPIIYFLIFKLNFGISAIWISMNLCQYFLAISFWIILQSVDWEKSAELS